LLGRNFISTYLKFISIFLFFGLIVSIATTLINYNISYSLVQEDIEKNSKESATQKRVYISNFIENIENNIIAIKKNQIFIDYLLNTNSFTEKTATNLFLSSINANKNYFQVRFLDSEGLEKIRVDRAKDTKECFVVPKDKLQDKSGRYYFRDTIQNDNSKFWYSNFDLNIERGEIEKPLRPTFRVSTNVTYKGKF
jgi:hypothetical protein